MSKIYQALEKAEKERELELRKDLPLPPESGQEEASAPETGQQPELIGGMTPKEDLVSFFEPNSLAAEQFRKLRAHLLKSRIPEPPKTIMVTSSTSSEGKSFVAANLAAGIANELRHHALLIDCDLRNPSLTKWFGLQEGKGLSDYLTGNGVSSEVILKTEVDKLSLLPAGGVRDNPTELIGSRRMETLVRELKSKQEERYIIFDATPLLATTEPEVLAKWVDGILLVVRAGITPRETVLQAIKSIGKEKILGVVLNDLDFRSSGLHNRYFGAEGYYYRYGYGTKNGNHNGKWGKATEWARSKISKKPLKD
jgi:protein-tyrosine kinase